MIKIVIQQCLSASLKLPEDNGTVHIGRGMIVFICFMVGADEDQAIKAGETVCKVKLSEDDSGKRVSIVDLPGDLLIIPQATLGGKLKGKAVQYHSNIDKEVGVDLFQNFCDKIVSLIPNEQQQRVRRGVFGAKQVLSTVTNGPFTHVFEL